MDDAKISIILEALDAFALALTNTGHVWTDTERKLYEKATDYLCE